jgi:hypothetical protein
MRDDAVAYVMSLGDPKTGADTPASNFARRVLKHLDGELKSMPSPSKALAEVGKEIRERVKGEFLKLPEPEPQTFTFKTPSRFSATFLGRTEDCLLGAAMDREFGQTGKPATLGSVTHEVLAAIGQQVYTEGMETIRPETAQKLATAHMGAMDKYPLSHEHYLKVLEFIGSWAMLDTFWPDADLWFLEELMTRTVGPHTYSGIIDRIEIRNGTARITDYKTGYRAPSVEAFKKRIQTPLYAWLADDFFKGIETVRGPRGLPALGDHPRRHLRGGRASDRRLPEGGGRPTVEGLREAGVERAGRHRHSRRPLRGLRVPTALPVGGLEPIRDGDRPGRGRGRARPPEGDRGAGVADEEDAARLRRALGRACARRRG